MPGRMRRSRRECAVPGSCSERNAGTGLDSGALVAAAGAVAPAAASRHRGIRNVGHVALVGAWNGRHPRRRAPVDQAARHQSRSSIACRERLRASVRGRDCRRDKCGARQRPARHGVAKLLPRMARGGGRSEMGSGDRRCRGVCSSDGALAPRATETVIQRNCSTMGRNAPAWRPQSACPGSVRRESRSQRRSEMQAAQTPVPHARASVSSTKSVLPRIYDSRSLG